MPELHAIIPGRPVPAARPRVTRYGTYTVSYTHLTLPTIYSV